jgi:hypothetical protein
MSAVGTGALLSIHMLLLSKEKDGAETVFIRATNPIRTHGKTLTTPLKLTPPIASSGEVSITDISLP